MIPSTLERASKATGYSKDAIVGPRRLRRLCWVRFAVMEHMHAKGHSLGEIGMVLHRHHTTVLSGLRQAQALRENEAYQIIRSAIA